MKTEILRCPICLEYTLDKICPRCNIKPATPKPAKFSIDDPYGRYRRLAKKQQGL